MLLDIFKFELKYRWRRPATHIYFVIMFLMAFGALTWDNLTVGGGTGQVKENAPIVLATMMVILSAIPGYFICSAIMGVPILRDFEHKTASILFTRPISKLDYLGGRFLGSFLITIYVFSGMVVGILLGQVMPWIDAEKFLAFQFWPAIQPFFILVIPSILVSGMLFFMSGSLFKNMLFVMVQGVILLAFFLVTAQMMSDIENRALAAIIDPTGMNLVNVISQYWTVAERNSIMLSFSGLLMANRLLWMGLAVVLGVVTYTVFSMRTVGNAFFKRKRKQKQVNEESYGSLEERIARLATSGDHKKEAPTVHFYRDIWSNFGRIWKQSIFYAKEVAFSVPFIAIMLIGFLMLGLNADHFNSMYGTEVYPTTAIVVNFVADNFYLFFIIIVTFYTGWLVWRERDLDMHLITDALPVPSLNSMVSKFLAFLILHVVILATLVVAGVLIQVFFGYYKFELGIYFSKLYSEVWFFLILYTLLGMFIQVIANQKFLGYALMIVFFIINYFVLIEMGFEHPMFQFGGGELGVFSDMNAFGHFLSPFSWQQVYWLGFALILFAISVIFAVRGTDAFFKTRVKLASMRFSRPVAVFSSTAMLLFLGSGCFLYYNHNILNPYENSDDVEKMQADYEKSLKKFENKPQPQIVETNLKVDVYPERRDFRAEGYYYLRNNTDAPISEVHIQYTDNSEVSMDTVYFERGASIREEWPEFYHQIYALDQPLAAGDSIKFYWALDFKTPGFKLRGSNTNVVQNGTFFNNTLFPTLGYEEGAELSDDDTRKEYDLPEKERALPRDDELGVVTNFMGDDANHIRFEIVMSTSPDQIAISPGYLQREWEDDGRRYFHYKMDMPMFSFYSMMSAQYEVKKETWRAPDGKDINLEIYYHPTHQWNLERMMEGMKESFTYFTNAFSPYQYRQMRIMEFPRYATFAQSFANTVPFSEAIGFVADVGKDDIDMPFYVTSHEMAHQWWGHQVMPANVQGSAMVSETMSQYSALMVMKHYYPKEMMQKFLKYELDQYLNGRATEQKKEMPLEKVESQGYIHYNKGSLVMYALQDYISEDSVNKALRKCIDKWAWRDDRFMTTDTMVAYFREVTPDSLQYLFTDMFETITLYENRVNKPTYTELGDDVYRIELPVLATKYRADSLGNESKINMADWIDIGVYTEGSDGKDSLLYLQKHKIDQDEMLIEIEVRGKPTKAGIDPLNILIDRNPEDNVATLSKKETS